LGGTSDVIDPTAYTIDETTEGNDILWEAGGTMGLPNFPGDGRLATRIEDENTERADDMTQCRHCGKDVTIMSMDIDILGGPTFKGPLCKDCSEYVQRNHRLPEKRGRKWWQFWK
jgi:hypothetical protein